jgi:pyridoxine 5-phosphate synthase
MNPPIVRLGVNLDHVATLRQARYVDMIDAPNAEPDVLLAASACERAGALGITVHLRADRRHIQDRDVFKLRNSVITKLNLEMGNEPEILETALQVLPDDVCLVPENRREVTTEGGLDVVRNQKTLRRTVDRLQAAGIRVSMFIEPAAEQIDAAGALGADAVELHTGRFANVPADFRADEVDRLTAAARHAAEKGLTVNAGHGLNYENVRSLVGVPYWHEFNIGHSIVCRSLFVGMEQAVREMIHLITPA